MKRGAVGSPLRFTVPRTECQTPLDDEASLDQNEVAHPPVRRPTLHPNTSKPIPQSERDAVTIENQRVLIRQYEWRLCAQQKRISVLERLVGAEKLGLQLEIENLRRALRDRSR